MKLDKGQKIPKFGAFFDQEYPVSRLEGFKNHSRLQVFFHKGCACVTPGCTNIGERVVRSIDSQGGVHWDLFTSDMILMTVDHIHPKSRGGRNELANYQPMCQVCNSLKGNRLITLETLSDMIKHPEMYVSKRQQKKKKWHSVNSPKPEINSNN